MQVYELSRDGGLIGEALRRVRAQEAARTGLHVSTIIGDVLRLQDPKKYDSEIAQETMLAFQHVGNVVETIVARELRRQIPGWEKPEPRRSREGIIGSPDGYSERLRKIDEMKACWTSERDFYESLKFFGYRMQMLFYMELFGAARGDLHVLFINGNYKPPFPKPRSFRLVPTRHEKRDNHEMLVQHAMDMGLLAEAA